MDERDRKQSVKFGAEPSGFNSYISTIFLALTVSYFAFICTFKRRQLSRVNSSATFSENFLRI